MPIITGSSPKALMGAPPVAENGPDHDPLVQAVDKFIPKAKKPPKIKKRAFGASQAGAAFRK